MYGESCGLVKAPFAGSQIYKRDNIKYLFIIGLCFPANKHSIYRPFNFVTNPFSLFATIKYDHLSEFLIMKGSPPSHLNPNAPH
jgi:hypothetical protein